MAKILTIEDEDNLRFTIRRSLANAGHAVEEAAGLEGARGLLREHDFDLVLTDVNLNGDNGVDLLRQLRGEGYDGAVIVITAYGTVESAVEAMRDGADDYLQKPVSLAELALVVDRALERRRQRQRLRLYERMDRARAESEQLLGDSPPWKRTLDVAARLGRMPLVDAGQAGPGGLPTVLLLGETGTGKGVLARFIHQEGVRTADERGDDPPFVHVNCSALPATLIESELFGHEKGAFTDAKQSRTGLFEMAEGGTIFLDEIGDMPLDLQAKLLLAVERGCFRRVGGSKEHRVRARIIAATNQNLQSRASAGGFRSDLYYRLSAFTVPIPPLREREGDSLLIAGAMLDRFARQYGRPGLRLGAPAEAAVRRHEWPGNVRELINAVQRAAMLGAGPELTPEDLGLGTPHQAPASGAARMGSGPGGVAADTAGGLVFDFDSGIHTADEVEKQLIVQALRKVGGNVSRAAKLIGMNRSSLRYRIERHALEDLVKEIARQ